jgi:Tfp pilus assembly protein PilW
MKKHAQHTAGGRRTILRSPREGGFSIIELLIYVAIFATMIGAVVGLAVLTTGQKVSSQATADINYQGEAALALITQTVHQANGITTPAAGIAGSSLSLVMSTSSVNPTVFSSYNDGSTNRLQVKEGVAATQNNLTNGHANITNLTFTNMSLPSTKGSVLISFTLSSKSGSARQEFSYSKNFFGAATIP